MYSVRCGNHVYVLARAGLVSYESNHPVVADYSGSCSSESGPASVESVPILHFRVAAGRQGSLPVSHLLLPVSLQAQLEVTLRVTACASVCVCFY